jgi:RNA polymerase sigma-54 factor
MAKMSLSLKQSQNLMMTPQLQQAIKLLTLTHLEMTNMIASEMVENPMLEEIGGEMSLDEVSKEHSKEVGSDDFSGPEIVEGGKESFDWEKYVETYNNNSSTPSTKESFSKDDAPNYENMVSKSTTLAEHLEWQLRMEELSDIELKLALDIIHNINDDGYLEENFDEIIANHKLEREEAYNILNLIHHLDPIGCGAVNLEECLLIQARAFEYPVPLVEKIIKHHLKDLKSKDSNKIAKDLGISIDAVKNAELIISNFHPKPGRLISPEEIQYVVPDIYIKEIGGEFVVVLNDEGVPRLKVSKLYQSLLKSAASSGETQEYVQEKLKSAAWLIKSIENRQKTIEKVAHAIVKYQPEFFKKGAAFLKPMILKDIAAEIGVHESTVSRVTTNKFVHTPLGTFELKYFFNAGIGGKNGGVDIAGESLKLKIKQLIDHEDPKRPISDQKISDILSKSDIVVARRTVTKYREMMDILPSSKRKQK